MAWITLGYRRALALLGVGAAVVLHLPSEAFAQRYSSVQFAPPAGIDIPVPRPAVAFRTPQPGPADPLATPPARPVALRVPRAIGTVATPAVAEALESIPEVPFPPPVAQVEPQSDAPLAILAFVERLIDGDVLELEPGSVALAPWIVLVYEVHPEKAR